MGSGNIVLNINSKIVGGSSANALDLSTASGDATITLGSGASFTRGIDVSGVSGRTAFEIGGTGNRRFDIGSLPDNNGNLHFEKNDTGRLTFTGGRIGTDKAFQSTSFNAGKVVFDARRDDVVRDNFTFRGTRSGPPTAGSGDTRILVAEDAVLEVLGPATLASHQGNTSASLQLAGLLRLRGIRGDAMMRRRPSPATTMIWMPRPAADILRRLLPTPLRAALRWATPSMRAT